MTSPVLHAYRLLTALIEPAGQALLDWRLRRGKEDPARMRERLGIPSLSRPAGRLVWLHGASVGEGVSLLPLIDALLDRGWQVLVTTGTVNAARVMADRLPAGALHQFVPLDLPGAVRRFLRHWAPELVLLAESELWPNLIHEIGRADIRLALVNARMSARSARRWARASGAIGALLAGVDLCLCQTAEDAGRLEALGARRVAVTGFLKFDVPAPSADPASLADFLARLGSRPVWIAASTHVDEEAALIETQGRLRGLVPEVLAIVVPRQPYRGAALAEAARRHGLVAARRSRGDAIEPDTDVMVADTLGELGLFYRAAKIVAMGKSLVAPGGGQNPIEPSKLGCAILHGPHVGNFRDIYGALDAAGGALAVAGSDGLVNALEGLLADASRVDALARAAGAFAAAETGATARTVAALRPLLRDSAETGA